MLQVVWSSNTAGLILHYDGSSSDSKAAGEGVFRDISGKMIFAYSVFFDQGTNMAAESLSLLCGLRLCEKMGVNNITVRIDCKVLIEMLNGDAAIPWKLRSIIKKISRY